jgi:hypothetical protein
MYLKETYHRATRILAILPGLDIKLIISLNTVKSPFQLSIKSVTKEYAFGSPRNGPHTALGSILFYKI